MRWAAWKLALAVGSAAGVPVIACTSFGSAPPPGDLNDGSVSDPPEGGTADVLDGERSAYARAVLQDGPIAYFRLGEDAGTETTSENGRHSGKLMGGAVLGAPGLLRDEPSTALTLDGHDARVDLGQSFDFDERAPFSIELWFNAHTLSGQYRMLVMKQSSGQIEAHNLYAESGRIVFERYVDGGGVKAQHSGSVPMGRAVHVVARYDGATMSLFVDGRMEAETADARLAAKKSGPFFIGGDGSGLESLDGEIDEVAIYDKALSVERIRAHYAAGRPE
ncbi:MAG: LamG domain-containing protein [Labilithrix sp.]|nr:LamG domain-containing protein [Labilithrix sp.]MCW5811958.1 LamG domain-containing protein [Labilithrix sp.]